MAKPIKLQFNKRRYGGFSGNQLKLIAFFLMLCDHVGYMLIENGVLYGQNPVYWTMALQTAEGQHWYLAARILRFIGRISFPLFAYMIVEGFLHTRNVRNYALRLLIFAILSEVPFDLACQGVIWYPEYQNVMFTLFLGVPTMALMERVRKHPLLQIVMAALGCAAGYLLRSDYGAAGVLLIAAMYLLRNERMPQLFVGAAISALESYEYCGVSALAFLLLRFYNGKRGDFSMKYFFYLMYPLHLLLFYALVYFGNR